MTPAAVHRYARLLPEFALRFDYIPGGSGSKQQLQVNRYLAIERDVRFGWNFVRTLIDNRISMPPDVDNEWLCRAWRFEFTGDDDAVMQALALDQPSGHHVADTLKMLLLHEEWDIARVAERLHYPVEVIQCYHDLFFNVKERLADEKFVVSQVWPEGRGVMFDPNYAKNLGFSDRIRRASFDGSVEQALVLAGHQAGWQSSMDLMTSSSAFERDVMAIGNLALHAGLGGQHNPSLTRASNMVVAAKASGQQSRDVQDQGGLMHATLGQSILGELHKSAAVAQEFQRQFQLQAAAEKASGDSKPTSS